jgi:hypothetical protein
MRKRGEDYILRLETAITESESNWVLQKLNRFRNGYHLFKEILSSHLLPSLRKLENRVLRKVFGSKRGDVTGDWRRLHSEELRDLNTRQILFLWSYKNQMGGAWSVYGGEERCIHVFGGERDYLEHLGGNEK